MVLIAIFPGQGSQSPGFLTPWLELDGVRERLAAYSEWSGVDLVAAGTEWDADRIRDTAVAQPLIVAAGLLSWNALGDDHVAGVAGHSVGEFTAAAAAGVLTEEGSSSPPAPSPPSKPSRPSPCAAPAWSPCRSRVHSTPRR